MIRKIVCVLTILTSFAPHANAQAPMGANAIQHVVFILKENHTFDNYFGAFPGVDGASKGKTHTGRMAVLRRPPDRIPLDIAHTNLAAMVGIDHGKMDRFDLLSGAFQEHRLMNYTQYQKVQIPNYWALASRFVIGDEFFTSEHGPSFPNHLFTIAAQADGAIDNPDEGGLWGCDSGPNTTVPIIDPKGGRHELAPCFDFQTVADSINTAGLTWRYYGALQGAPGYVWSAFDAIQHIRMGPQWQTNVLADSRFAGDVAGGPRQHDLDHDRVRAQRASCRRGHLQWRERNHRAGERDNEQFLLEFDRDLHFVG